MLDTVHTAGMSHQTELFFPTAGTKLHQVGGLFRPKVV